MSAGASGRLLKGHTFERLLVFDVRAGCILLLDFPVVLTFLIVSFFFFALCDSVVTVYLSSTCTVFYISANNIAGISIRGQFEDETFGEDTVRFRQGLQMTQDDVCPANAILDVWG